MIDGIDRDKCVLKALNVVKEGGYIYLDDVDKHPNAPDGELRIAENRLLDAVRLSKGTIENFLDFVPTYFGVTGGILVKI